jgi:hypothetical protein
VAHVAGSNKVKGGKTMSHNIEHRTYIENIHRDFVKRELDHYVSQADWQEGCSGLYREIRWLDNVPVQEDYETAIQYIEDHDRRDYDNLAVRYYEYMPKQSAKRKELEMKVRDAYNEYVERERAVWASTVTAQFVTCKGCGSKLSRIHIRENRCPVCRTDLRPETQLKRVAAAKAKWEKVQQAKRDYEKAHSDKKIMWLVKFEYHT